MIKNAAGGPPANGLYSLGALHPLDAIVAAKPRLMILAALLHIVESAWRRYEEMPMEEREPHPDPFSWWEDSLPGEVYLGATPTEVLLAMLTEYEHVVTGLIQSFQRADARERNDRPR